MHRRTGRGGGGGAGGNCLPKEFGILHYWGNKSQRIWAKKELYKIVSTCLFS